MDIGKVILIIAALASMLVIISIASNLLHPFWFKPKRLEGNSEIIVPELLRYVYQCYEKNYGRRESVVCYELEFSSKDEITSSYILEKLDESKVSKNSLVVEDLGRKGLILIRYENGKVYVKKVENERISS